MRITGGGAKSIRLKVDEKVKVRPATDFMREAVFSSLGELVKGAKFLDLFAGSGAYGLEALSRGAKRGVFVEKNRRMNEVIKGNLDAVCKSIGTESSCCEVICADVFQESVLEESTYDLVFVDPPYALFERRKSMLVNLLPQWLKSGPETRLIVEVPGNMEALGLEGLTLLRRLGKSGKGPSVLVYGCL